MASLQKIDHIVVLMLENRSFDSLLGTLYPKSDSFEGLNGTEQNPDANGTPVVVWNSPGTDETTMRIRWRSAGASARRAPAGGPRSKDSALVTWYRCIYAPSHGRGA